MRILFGAFLLLLMTGCTLNDPEKGIAHGNRLSKVTFEGHSYIMADSVTTSQAVFVLHDPDCKCGWSKK